MSTTARRPIAIIAAILAVVLALGACSSTANPSSYIKDKYQRDASLDENGIQAYVASGKDPEVVATEISTNAQPLDRRTSSENAAADGGNSVFLQYQNVIVSIFPYQDGSRVMLGDYRRAHSVYFAYIGGFWASTPGTVGGGSNNRGGGSGSGK
ncbi:DUF4247 domain-containing protein [Epidermidibacterium keratini]|uniref:DUF4247 domain-containing protein n=1 Tax=Epidermidibacterium keratini TaxID=1891644 RepID=A0A7L4YPY8_9ACTN|nr:DUF4247 domain-containing protein [Epidermidibacterium keratini]QHC01190.1 DUF4247 domain-containing protein [Epidermidibacterium keratini]